MPQTEWSLFSAHRQYLQYTFMWTDLFRRADLVYFLFNPPGDNDHFSNANWQSNYQTWIDSYMQTTWATLTQEQFSTKYDAIKEALTLWEAGGSGALANMTEAQRGYVKVFHPLYSNSPWNHPSECEQIALGNTSTETFCRWRNLILLDPAIWSYLTGTPSERRGVESIKNTMILTRRQEGYTYLQILQWFD